MNNFVTKEVTITNNSEYFILVGNCHDVISQHLTLEEALTASNSISVTDSKWGTIRILEPNESCSGNYTQTLHEEQDDSLFDF